MAGLLPANHTAPLYSAGERRLDTAKAAKFKSCEAHHFAVTAVAHRASLRGWALAEARAHEGRRHTRTVLICCAALSRYWHEAAFRWVANV